MRSRKRGVVEPVEQAPVELGEPGQRAWSSITAGLGTLASGRAADQSRSSACTSTLSAWQCASSARSSANAARSASRRWKKNCAQHAPVVGVVPDHLDRQHLGVAEDRVLVGVERERALVERVEDLVVDLRVRLERLAGAVARDQLADVGVGDRDEVAAGRIERVEEQARLAGERPALGPRTPACSRRRSCGRRRSPAAGGACRRARRTGAAGTSASQSIAFSKRVHRRERMQLRVGDDADRMRARGQRDQPDPVAGADQVVGREPARRRLAARAPGRVVRTSRRSRSGRRCGTRRRWRRGRSPRASPSLRLSRPARPQASTSQRASAAWRSPPCAPVDAVRRRRRRPARCRAPVAPSTKRDAAARAPPRRGSSRRCRGRSGSSAPRGSGSRRSRSPRRCRAGPPTKKKRKPNFFSCALLQVLLQAEHLAEVVGADLDRRLADLVRGLGHRMARGARAPGSSRSAKRCFSCSASVRPARPPPAMTTS